MTTDPRSNEELNRVIAEWMGWKFCPSTDYPTQHGAWVAQPECWVHDDHETVWDENKLPHYCTDLNACHEAEMKLSDEQHKDFQTLLFRDYFYSKPNTTSDQAERDKVSAGPRQRAEAMVRVIGENHGH